MKHNICRYVDSYSTNDYFIPFKTYDEWSKFLTNTPADVYPLPCAYPAGEGTFSYGPTSMKKDMGDEGDEPTAKAPQLPFWRSGEWWPRGDHPTHPFNHKCFEHRKQDKCWHEYTEYYRECDPPKNCHDECNPFGFCSQVCDPGDCHDRSRQVCDDWGSTCEKDWTEWSETFDFYALAKNGETFSPSWDAFSSHVGGTTRPNAVCTKRCVFVNNHDCVCGPTPAAEECTVPDQLLFDGYAMYYCANHPQELMSCAAMGLVVTNFENQIAQAPTSCDKARIRIDENKSVARVNDAAYKLFIMYGGK